MKIIFKIKKRIRKYKFQKYLIKIQKKRYEGIINLRLNHLTDFDNDLTADLLVLSKDRAMQLHMLLATYREMVKNCHKITVLYTASSYEHDQSYNELVNLFQNVVFVKEENFKNDILKIFKASNSSKIAFMTDDQFFKEKIDFLDVAKFNAYKFLFSMSKGMDTNINFGRKDGLPNFIKDYKDTNNFLYWKWDTCLNLRDWSYPLNVSGVFYSRLEFVKILEMIDFKGPNSLESLLQGFNKFFLVRYGVCAKQSILGVVPCNVVSSESNCPTTGVFSSNELLEKWKGGYRIEYEKLYYQSFDDLFNVKFEFVKR